ARPGDGEAVLAGHRMLLDLGRLQEGDTALAGTRHAAVARLSAVTAAETGVKDGDLLAVTGPAGTVELAPDGHRHAGPGGLGAAELGGTRHPRRYRSEPGRPGADRPRRRTGSFRRTIGGTSVTGLAALTTAPERVVLAAEDLSMFGTDPWWLVAVKAVFCFAFLMLIVLFSIVWERKVVAWMQLRIGPNRHGPWGLLQSLADGIKLMLKEDVVVKGSDKAVYILAPILAAIPAFMAIAVIPFGPAGNEISIFGTRTTMQLTDLPIAALYILAVGSVGVYGFVLGGWSSGSTYPLLGGIRSCAQMISYEIAMGAAFASVFLYSGSMSTSTIVEAQADRWYIILLPVSFLIYMVTMVGEASRAPFDMPESEGDLVGGFNTEYSSIKFAMFMLAEYIHMVTVSMIAVTLFLGGWRAPFPVSAFWEGANHGWWPMLWFFLKLQALIFFFIWLRGTLPRVRYDQLMKLGWKVLIPVSVVWLMLVATVRALRNEGYDFSRIVLYVGAAVLAILLISFVVDIFRDRRRRAETEAAGPEPAFDPMAGGYPVPPLPGQTLPPVPRRRPRRERELVVSGGPDTQSDGNASDGKEAGGV
ncbi:NADH-quinone oxidoreductase subunit H, partial [Streptomyces sp. Ncost-T6T-2b]